LRTCRRATRVTARQVKSETSTAVTMVSTTRPTEPQIKRSGEREGPHRALLVSSAQGGSVLLRRPSAKKMGQHSIGVHNAALSGGVRCAWRPSSVNSRPCRGIAGNCGTKKRSDELPCWNRLEICESDATTEVVLSNYYSTNPWKLRHSQKWARRAALQARGADTLREIA
jgi:hypothetical protein